MRKIFKTSMAVALSVCMAAALTACGGSGSSASSEPAAEATEAADAAEETADTGAKIKIGGSGPLTGPAAVYGQAVKNAAEIAVEEVNAKGGLQFELDMEDDAHDPEKAVTAYGFSCNRNIRSRRGRFSFLRRGPDLRDHAFRIFPGSRLCGSR